MGGKIAGDGEHREYCKEIFNIVYANLIWGGIVFNILTGGGISVTGNVAATWGARGGG